MRLFAKLLLGFAVLVLAVLALDSLARYRREVALFDGDLRRDSRVFGAVLVAALEHAWKVEGDAGAARLVGAANQAVPGIAFDWIWLDQQNLRLGLLADRLGAAALSPGQAVSDTADGELVTFVGGAAPSGRQGALVIRQSLAEPKAYVRTTLRNAALVTLALLAVAGVLATALGHRLVARPVAMLVEKARRIGRGDLEGPLVLGQRDELGELAVEMNRMCETLAAEIGARQAATEQLRHADRLMTVGKLASGLAHELGTPLNVVSGRASLIADGDVEGDEGRDSARIIVEQARRMTNIIRQLLEFARPRRPQLAEIDLQSVARRTVDLVHPITRKAGVEVDIADGGPVLARADDGQVQQVLTNLLVNATQATPSGGHVRVECGVRQVGAPRAGSWAWFRVSDTGAGMDERTRERIFEPFFTTKEVGSGTGLGLSVSYGIVAEHGGWIDVESAPGKGSRFTVYLPVSGSSETPHPLSLR